ncbi:MAG: VWA domain-containing protein [Phycisphaerales bacterium]|jgi:Ca-activated chloride channel family protein|nr:VWA domain-containing protein [Phycisphaerales bacterium]MDP6310606.1 VWA domain-containing protein [Phycisphaerales bacterium]MDP7087392.1 VWA domain-containing protein [Phycisphaerales bacterium]MDP7189195.1 VWA domain-containing protein [Phycisphaerales bacterium]MDP7519850.1 VWA domain-containing protein [Phycisphaerales bacterium]|tara:strand:+ start:6773 stop:7864 length:1092 start_codon:yes stop_codon:yes gene_type:complete
MLSFHPDMLWWLLLLIPMIPLAWWRFARRSARPAVPWSTTAAARTVPHGWAARTRWVLPGLRTLAIVMLVILMVGPIKGDEQTSKSVEGVAIELVIDRSGSMQALDLTLNGRQVDRLEVVKAVAADFVLGEAELPGREHDLIGLITFGTYADSICPMTLDYTTLAEALDQVRPATEAEGANTAIGDALALAASRLNDLEDRTDLNTDDIRSRIVILLTDGADTASEIDPVAAADMAAALGIKVYTIGVGRQGLVPMPMKDAFGRTHIQQVRSDLDETTLQAIAEATGGRFFRAQNTKSLAAIYAEIDALEKTEVAEERFFHYTDLAVTPVTLGGVHLPPLLIFPMLVLLLEIVLATTRYRTIP